MVEIKVKHPMRLPKLVVITEEGHPSFCKGEINLLPDEQMTGFVKKLFERSGCKNKYLFIHAIRESENNKEWVLKNVHAYDTILAISQKEYSVVSAGNFLKFYKKYEGTPCDAVMKYTE